MSKIGRPIGSEIRTACAALDKHGPATGQQLAEASGIARNRINKLMVRAESYGLVGADYGYPRVFWVRMDWRSRIEAPRVLAAKPQPQRAPRVASVWQLGAVG